jgi:hypothetical protein
MTSVASAVNKLYFHIVLLMWESAHPDQFNLQHNAKRVGCLSNGTTDLLSERKHLKYHKDISGLFILNHCSPQSYITPTEAATAIPQPMLIQSLTSSCG